MWTLSVSGLCYVSVFNICVLRIIAKRKCVYQNVNRASVCHLGTIKKGF